MSLLTAASAFVGLLGSAEDARVLLNAVRTVRDLPAQSPYPEKNRITYALI